MTRAVGRGNLRKLPVDAAAGSWINGGVILIVDDFEDGAQALCLLLGRAGYPCQWVPNGPEALALVRGHPPEEPLLVILDEMMPGMSGVEVLRAIRSDPAIAHTAVLFHSAGFDLQRRDEAMTLGAVAWLLKGGVEENLKSIGQWYTRVGGVRSTGNAGGEAAKPAGESEQG
jgi:CheY-like chemotaxis protein